MIVRPEIEKSAVVDHTLMAPISAGKMKSLVEMYHSYIEFERWPNQIIHGLFAINDASRFHLGKKSDLEIRALQLGSSSG